MYINYILGQHRIVLSKNLKFMKQNYTISTSIMQQKFNLLGKNWTLRKLFEFSTISKFKKE